MGRTKGEEEEEWLATLPSFLLIGRFKIAKCSGKISVLRNKVEKLDYTSKKNEFLKIYKEKKDTGNSGQHIKIKSLNYRPR